MDCIQAASSFLLSPNVEKLACVICTQDGISRFVPFIEIEKRRKAGFDCRSNLSERR